MTRITKTLERRLGTCSLRGMLLLALSVSVMALLPSLGWLSHTGDKRLTSLLLSSELFSSSPASTAASSEPSNRQERIKFFVDTYNYHPPDEAQLVAPASPTELCGSAPNFEKYFAGKSNWYRSQFGEDKALNKHLFQRFAGLKEPHPGHQHTFLELGAFDGHHWSNTRFLEFCLNWNNGVMIEASPGIFPKLLSKRPRTHRLSFAPSCRTQQNVTMLADAKPGSRVRGNTSTEESKQETVEVPCGPLGPVLEDLVDGYVTFFSLDVEGSEPRVLETIDFKKVQIDIFMIEAIRRGEGTTRQGETNDILAKNGYRRYEGVVDNSDVFIHKDSAYQLDANVFQPAKDVA